jgi:YfiH family protein
MVERDVMGIRYLTYEIFEPYVNVTNVVTTRHRGRSVPPYGSLNLALHVGDDPDAVLENRAIIAQLFGFEPEWFTVSQQIHGSAVAVVGSHDRGSGAIVEGDAVKGADAMVTNAPGTPLMILVADCVALSLFDPRNNAIGIAHAGWRGTCGRIAEKTVQTLVETYGSDPADILVGVGPSVGPCHFTVGSDVVDAFRGEFGDGISAYLQEDPEGTSRLDLWEANTVQLLTAGVSRDHIEQSGLCTVCRADLFFSHRYHHGFSGRFAAVMMLHATGSRMY